jgi:L-ectoine synthase
MGNQMIIRRKSDVPSVEWGNGVSYRLIVADDGMGFSIAHTVASAGSKSRMQYIRHIEACYCISGRGQVFTPGGVVHDIEPGCMYALDQHDPHYLVASEEGDLELISVFLPALQGDERHDFSSASFSNY